MKISRGICRGEHGLGADLPGFRSGPCHLHAEGPGTSEFSSLWLRFLTWKMKLSLYPHLSPLSKSCPFFKVQFRCHPPPPPPMKPFPVFPSLVLCACSSCHLSHIMVVNVSLFSKREKVWEQEKESYTLLPLYFSLPTCLKENAFKSFSLVIWKHKQKMSGYHVPGRR